MASIRKCAADVFDVAKDGIGWIALWKEGRSWKVSTIFPETDDYFKNTIEVSEDDMSEIISILAIDQNAILVNGYYHNLGVSETHGTCDDLAGGLRWQYEECSSHLAGYKITVSE